MCVPPNNIKRGVQFAFKAMPYYDRNGKRRGNFEREREKKGGFSFFFNSFVLFQLGSLFEIEI